MLNSLITYFRLVTPIEKTNTVSTLIEEATKRNQAQLEERGMRLLKKLEEDLPEVIVPDEQLKYILDSILQYLITSTLPNGSIEFLTRSFILEKGAGEVHPDFEEYGGYIEISVVFVGDRESVEESEATSGRIPSLNRDEMLELMLQMARETVLKNRGTMKFETDEKRAKKIISLEFPIERRKEVIYELTGIN